MPQIDSDASVGNPLTIKGQLAVSGNASQDYPQVVVNCIASQSAKAISVKDSTGTEKFSVDASGVATLAGAPVYSGGNKVTGFTDNALVGATVTLTAAQSGGVFSNRSTSGTPIFTLPAAASGLVYTFVVKNTTAGFAVQTLTTSVIHAKTSAAGTAITSTATTGKITNTQATAVVGDLLTLVCDGTDWWATSISGIYAAT